MNESDSIADIERRLLRRWGWMLPVFAAAAALAVATHGWAWVTLDPSLARAWFGRAGLAAGAAGALAGVGLWCAWRLGLRLDGTEPKRAAARWGAVLLAATLICVGDRAFSVRQVQEPFWLAVRARLRPGNVDYFIRELASLRLSAMESRETRRAIILAGSSQLLHGIDIPRLQEVLGDRTVLRRSLAGMDPLKACGARGYFSLRKGDLLLMYIGESDVGANPTLAADWIRPLATWSGTRAVLRVLGPHAGTYWRQLVDLGMASTLACWRDRDYLRHLLFHVRAPEAVTPSAAPGELLPDHRTAYGRASTDQPFNEVHYRACADLARAARARGVRVVVLEGQVNPAIRTPAAMALAGQVRARLQGLAAEHGFRYVALSEQALDLVPADWLDGAHLSESGRMKFTRMVSRVVLEERP